MALEIDDVIEVDIESLSGVLDIEVKSIDDDKVYVGNNVDSGSFQLNIAESNKYIFKVSGKNAKGSVSFRVAD